MMGGWHALGFFPKGQNLLNAALNWFSVLFTNSADILFGISFKSFAFSLVLFYQISNARNAWTSSNSIPLDLSLITYLSRHPPIELLLWSTQSTREADIGWLWYKRILSLYRESAHSHTLGTPWYNQSYHHKQPIAFTKHATKNWI